MTYHHDKHYAGYVKNLNAALANTTGITLPPGASLSQVVQAVGTPAFPKDREATIRNNGGGAWNHALFWKVGVRFAALCMSAGACRTCFHAAAKCMLLL
jgi:Fe-Mn family superoxide dismutase